MAYVNPTIAEFKIYFQRDFPFGSDIASQVTDADLEKAYGQAAVNINQALFNSQNAYRICYLLLWAHYLVVDLRMSSQGINGQYSFLEQSKSVGSVSQSFAIPQRILENPYMAMLTKTNYGAKYLELVLPSLTGQVFIAYGSTRP